jgi:hypothetical protein
MRVIQRWCSNVATRTCRVSWVLQNRNWHTRPFRRVARCHFMVYGNLRPRGLKVSVACGNSVWGYDSNFSPLYCMNEGKVISNKIIFDVLSNDMKSLLLYYEHVWECLELTFLCSMQIVILYDSLNFHGLYEVFLEKSAKSIWNESPTFWRQFLPASTKVIKWVSHLVFVYLLEASNNVSGYILKEKDLEEGQIIYTKYIETEVTFLHYWSLRYIVIC